jgi:outer membrane protein OmpA-like peptidoglycan-associated protein
MGVVIVYPGILFGHGSPAILPASRTFLEDVAKVLKEHPEILRVAVQGHAAANERSSGKLSTARANAVVEALVKMQVDRARLVVEGFGLELPRNTNETDKGRADNRRVEFKILERTSCPIPNANVSPGGSGAAAPSTGGARPSNEAPR